MSNWTPLLLVWLLSALMMLTLQQSNAEPNLANHKLSGLIKWKYEKRPFCNAFTGCGKKRTPTEARQLQLDSLPPPPPYALLKRANEAVDVDTSDFNANPDSSNNNRNYYSSNSNSNMNLNANEDLGEGLSDLIDINAEPAVENVQQQIMSQAKIFEAIREASREIFRQRNRQKQLQNQLMLNDPQQADSQHRYQQQQQQKSSPASLQLLAKSMESEA